MSCGAHVHREQPFDGRRLRSAVAYRHRTSIGVFCHISPSAGGSTFCINYFRANFIRRCWPLCFSNDKYTNCMLAVGQVKMAHLATSVRRETIAQRGGGVLVSGRAVAVHHGVRLANVSIADSMGLAHTAGQQVWPKKTGSYAD